MLIYIWKMVNYVFLTILHEYIGKVWSKCGTHCGTIDSGVAGNLREQVLKKTPLSTTPLSSGNIVCLASQRINLSISKSVSIKEHIFVITTAFL